MNILQIARRIRKQQAIDRSAIALSEKYVSRHLTDEEKAEINEKSLNTSLDNLREECRIAKLIQQILIEEGLSEKKGFKDNLESNNWWWITIRPPPNSNITFTNFKHWVEGSLLTNIDFDKWLYAYEQKGESTETMGSGFHIHLMVHSPNYIQKKDLLAKLKTQAKILLNIPHKSQFPLKFSAMIDLQKIHTQSQINNYKEYMKGNKKQADKQYAVQYDKIFRQRYNLQDLYEHNMCEPPSPEGSQNI